MKDLNDQQDEISEILVVDDTLDSLKLLVAALSSQGYKIRPATSGRLALESVANKVPDLILLDVKMPDMDGYEVCRRLKTRDAVRSIPVIFLSAMGQAIDKVKAFEVGGVDYVTKPFQVEEVLVRVKTHLSLKRMQIALKRSHDALEERVRQRTLELETANEKLKQEVAHRKKAQKALQKERERLNVTLRSIGDGVITTDIDGRVVLINEVAEMLTGWSQSEAAGCMLDEVFHIINEHTGRRCANPATKVLETDGIVGLANDTVLVARDGTRKIIADSGAPIRDINGTTIGVVIVFRDITEKIKLETELQHAHKMEAIGNLAGGIAHEFNNVLGIIIGNVELAIEDLEQWHPVTENLSEIKLASLRAKDVVKQLLSFSRKMDIKREPVDIRIIVKETLKLLKASLPSSIQVRENLPEAVDTVVADPTQIHQLLINLCTNAAHAMGENGGSLTIELSNVTLDFTAASKHPDLKPGDYVRFSVSDTGHGIPVNLLDKIFDPYFTTKDVTQGTGMGLAVVHGIVKTHNGAIDVASNVGMGTAFHIYFPASKEKARLEVRTAKKGPTGSEKILLVDDEISIVNVCRRNLERLGYTVSSETDPVRIIERFRSTPYAYDLVILDMTMPRLTGDRLAQELLKIRPDIPIVICTGFSEKLTPEKVRQLGIKGLMTKPIERDDLADTVRKVLDDTKVAIH